MSSGRGVTATAPTQLELTTLTVLFTLRDVIGAGDKVVVIMRPPTDGDEPAPAVADVAIFRSGKVTEIVHYSNPDDALAAAGA
jgi:ketosteroid isomerase-like protein